MECMPVIGKYANSRGRNNAWFAFSTSWQSVRDEYFAMDGEVESLRIQLDNALKDMRISNELYDDLYPRVIQISEDMESLYSKLDRLCPMDEDEVDEAYEEIDHVITGTDPDEEEDGDDWLSASREAEADDNAMRRRDLCREFDRGRIY